MKLSEHIGTLVKEHKERSVAIMRFVEQTLVPQTLQALLTIKTEESGRAANNALSTHHAKKGRSPAKNSKGYKLLVGKEKELAADRRLKRFNIVTLLEKLHDVMDGVRHQDGLVTQV